MKIIRTPKKIKFYKTSVSPEKTIEEIKATLKKYECRGFAWIENPKDEKQAVLQFQVPIKNNHVNVRIELPEVHVKLVRETRYLKKESYRYLKLLIEAKISQIELGEPIEEIFFTKMLTPDNRLLRDIVMKDIPMLTQGDDLHA